MKKFKTEQEEFWAGKFGDDYIKRNKSEEIIAGNINLFSKVLRKTYKINSVLEVGANIGLNLIALKYLLPRCNFTAVEINKNAYYELKKLQWVNSYNESILTFKREKKHDLTFTKGVLIHINPNDLEKVYKKLYNFSKKYILIVEYYSPIPVNINYRGHADRLFKRDFAGDMLNLYSDLNLIDYGFIYHLDTNFPQDDLNWFLLKKTTH